jgi:hypothetical protein
VSEAAGEEVRNSTASGPAHRQDSLFAGYTVDGGTRNVNAYMGTGDPLPIATKPLDVNPDEPHRWEIASLWGECLICGGSRMNPIHAEPLEGWE